MSPDSFLIHGADERRGFAPLCPDLVVELASPSDEGPHAAAVEVWPAIGAPQWLEQLQTPSTSVRWG